MSGPAEKPRRPFPTVRLSLALLALLIVAMVGYYWFRVRPWVAAPDASERTRAGLWEAVERAAREPAPPSGPPDELKGALRRLAEVKVDLEPALARWRERALTRADRDALLELREVGERLVRWSRAGGGFGPGEPCAMGEDLPPREVFLVGQLTLAQADVLPGGPSREEQLRAVLRLSTALRRGAGPMHLAAGMRLAEHLAAAARRMGALDVLRAEPALAPTPVEIWRGANVEAYCGDVLLERSFGELSHGWPQPTPATRDVPRSWIVPGPAYYQRERAMLRWWWGERLAAAAAHALDPPRLAAALRLPADPDELPRSLLVRLRAVDLADLIESAGRSVEAYREALATTP